MDEELQYAYWLANIRPLSDRKKCRLKEEVGQVSKLYYIEEIKLHFFPFLEAGDVEAILKSRKGWDVKAEYERMRSMQIQIIPFGSLDYPERLNDISAPPYALYVKGRLPQKKLPSAAIVGARECSPYGRKQAQEFAQALAVKGIQIISGMARGIDGAAQEAAMAVGGSSFGVLASGVDICYPREHIGLYMDLQKQGGVLSEQTMKTAPLSRYFPARNRIISGLADIVLVMEAREKSGSLITADMAMEQGKEVYALPGPVSSNLSYGCNSLIAQGAGILLSPEELLRELEIIWAGDPFKRSILCGQKAKNLPKNKIVLENTEKLVYSRLDLQPKDLNQLIRELKLPVKVLIDILVSLEMNGFIREISKNYYTKV